MANARRTIFITAPNSGIGEVLVRHSLEQGHFVVGLGRKKGKEFCERLRNEGHDNIQFIWMKDSSDEASVNEAFREARKVVDDIDGLIHCVGGSLISKPLISFTIDEFQRVLATNLISSFLISREAINWMKETQGGNIVLFGSTTGFEPAANKGAYAVAKAGVHMLVASLALECSQFNIIVNGIAPGYVLTPRHQEELKSLSERQQTPLDDLLNVIKAKNPLKRILKPSDLCSIVDLLLTTKEIQGQIIRADLGQILYI